jgi:uncharacterized protein (DUF2126 family)/transglutaminase-like putative cysteine protease
MLRATMRVRIRHETRYRYDEPALLGPQLVRLRPAEHARARVLSYALHFAPKGEVRWQQDPWGNRVARLTMRAGEALREFAVTVDLAVDVQPVNPFDFFVDDRCREVPFTYPDGLDHELAPFLLGAHAAPGPRLADFLTDVPAKGYVTDHLVAMNAKVAAAVRYVIRNEPGIQSSEETLALGSGSCRDSALLLCDALRAQGFATRFVSGYLVQLADEGNIPDLARGVARDVVDLHAWCEVYVPGAGWIGLDGTSGLLTGEGHIPLACTVRPELAAPIEGTASVAQGGLDFRMEVARLGHEPSPRTPYTDDAWAALKAAGTAVDATLRERGLRLTMGGEPTWTSRAHAEAPEWNEAALGPTKWAQGLELARELAARLGEGTLLLERMGKLYPGESLPRWALHLLWRTDGAPIWRTPALQDLRSAPPATTATVGDAQRFAARLAARLGVDDGAILPAYEDPWAAITREENLPVDVDPLAARLDDPEERRTLARALGHGLHQPTGYVLPLAFDAWAAGGPRFVTSRWTLRRAHLFLLFGDSPIGLRLPLDRVDGRPRPLWPEDITTGPAAFAREAANTAPLFAQQSPARIDAQARGESIHTAVCVEPRDGVLHVFLPPLPSADAFLALIAAIEDVAAEVSQPVRLEGYAPPSDPRLGSCLVTPDPGVLEVNVSPTETFDAYVAQMETIADAANHAGLRPDKYRIDGREVGSGGGHHLTLGGPTTVESPFLKEPALFAGLLRYVNGHPALSYLFTGLFVGPTSQAPRIDEARHDALYELEIALAHAEGAVAPPPWLTDRLFRDLLVDVAGNGHRTEICIDKLYDPASASGRQGLVEFRAFEMPPHERLAAAQMLLVRALVARLAKEPYRAPLVRWGSQLHDRFMLPLPLWNDLRDVLADLRAHGLPLDEAWYAPFVDHRFPIAGTLRLDDALLEVRTALEPWPVLGEEPGAHGGTSRYVDASVERVQVRTEGLVEGRHLVLVNGLTVPLRPTGRAGEHVAGVRFRAWQPPRSLQPHLGVHHPLRFDVVDTWARRSLGACTYHVWHPEGRAYTAPPLTAFEAAARRAQRFTTIGHAPFPVEPVPTRTHDEQPFTLDLRRYPIDQRLPGAG